MISLKRLKQVLSYDPSTGIFRWRVEIGQNASKHYPGEVAGAPRSPGSYIQIGIDRTRYYAHRLAWFYVNGEWPIQVDHKDRNKQNNALQNLRNATHTQNMANATVHAKNKLGVKGVRAHRCCQGYSVRVGGQYIGSFRTVEEAQAAHHKASVARYGEFARSEKR